MQFLEALGVLSGYSSSPTCPGHVGEAIETVVRQAELEYGLDEDDVQADVFPCLALEERIRPLDDRVAVIPDAWNKGFETQVGLDVILFEESHEPPTKGMVLAVGPGRVLDDGSRARPEVRPGQRVVFDPRAGSRYHLQADGDQEVEIRILESSDVAGILDED